jgi:hypothetical protein
MEVIEFILLPVSPYGVPHKLVQPMTEENGKISPPPGSRGSFMY